jgi:hypothetical protein
LYSCLPSEVDQAAFKGELRRMQMIKDVSIVILTLANPARHRTSDPLGFLEDWAWFFTTNTRNTTMACVALDATSVTVVVNNDDHKLP